MRDQAKAMGNDYVSTRPTKEGFFPVIGGKYTTGGISQTPSKKPYSTQGAFNTETKLEKRRMTPSNVVSSSKKFL